MPDPIKPGNISFDISFKKAASHEPVDEDAPLRITVLGGFSGSAASSRAAYVDVDNFDAVCAGFQAALRVADGGGEIELRFQHLDDFHPDRLLQKVPSLAKLVELRSRVADPSTADAAAAELRDFLGGSLAASSAESSPAPAAAQAESASDLIARLLGKPASGSPTAAAAANPKSIVEQLIAKSVAPASVPAASPAQVSLLSTLDADLSKRLRAVMHHPDFQALESAWRGLDFLVRNAGDNVKLHALAISCDELASEFATPGNPLATALGRTLEQLAPAVVLSAFCFGEKDTALLGQIAKLAAACGTAFIAGGDSDLAGCTSFAKKPNPIDWTPSPCAAFAELRRAPDADHLGLALPRFLLRQPYAPGSDAIETFPFNELPAENDHECKLWGSAAFLCGQLLLDSFSNEGWEMELGGTGGEIGGLPVHTFKQDGGKEVTPCAEAWLTEKAADTILSRGLMPVLSVRGRDSVLLVSLRSISEPARALA
ncbi:MAG: type VI secretion system contractile sheath large subunit, partial [Chthoniobacteraceae bacterium]